MGGPHAASASISFHGRRPARQAQPAQLVRRGRRVPRDRPARPEPLWPPSRETQARRVPLGPLVRSDLPDLRALMALSVPSVLSGPPVLMASSAPSALPVRKVTPATSALPAPQVRRILPAQLVPPVVQVLPAQRAQRVPPVRLVLPVRPDPPVGLPALLVLPAPPGGSRPRASFSQPSSRTSGLL